MRVCMCVISPSPVSYGVGTIHQALPQVLRCMRMVFCCSLQKKLQAQRVERVRREFVELLEEAVELHVQVLTSDRLEAAQAAAAGGGGGVKKRKREEVEVEEGEAKEDHEVEVGEVVEQVQVEPVSEQEAAGQLTMQVLEKYWANDERWKVGVLPPLITIEEDVLLPTCSLAIAH